MPDIFGGLHYLRGTIQHEHGPVAFHGAEPVAQAAALSAAVALTADRIVAGRPVLAIGTVAPEEVKITNPVQVVIGGEFVTVAAQEVAFTATTHDIADPDTEGREAYYVLSADDEGAVTITKGTTAALEAATIPATPEGEVRLGYLLIAHDGSAIFNATTDALDAAHLTVTYTDDAADDASAAIDALITRVAELEAIVANLGFAAAS